MEEALSRVISKRQRMDSDKPRLSRKDAALNKALDEELAANPDAFPKAVYFIVPNELCERFAYYGINTLFNQYLKTGFGIATADAKSIMHLFTGFAFLCPLAGAAVSDSFLGKYQTILYLSLVYLLGNFLITLFSIPGVVGEYGSYPKWSFMLPALLIALGMGGIKPCVSSHGGDQFLPSQTKLMDRFFAIFYASINIGALSSLYLTPYVKEYTTCFNHPCYALAYGIPTVTFFIALVVFIIGRRYYRVVPPQGEFLPWKSLKVATLAARRSLAAPRDERQGRHWLSYAEGDYSRRFIEETRLLGRVIVMFIPIVFYWMLYCQNGTEWQNQYEKMDKNFFRTDLHPHRGLVQCQSSFDSCIASSAKLCRLPLPGEAGLGALVAGSHAGWIWCSHHHVLPIHQPGLLRRCSCPRPGTEG
ncbi:hypothetical protein DSO57_1010357 [Entomophthora muscae]|uniref:Uncharacterized protein n=1 Tax=Entomophthora muscae TaxID=34485 RepID=A0ACC2UFX8_9FUNG|nr:hypothetical protein DSO57_1010357 [Entomophthora muscae]